MNLAANNPGKWALLIGIDRYPHVRPLSGCVNDARVMRQVLQDSFRFPEDHIMSLTDEQATRDGILAAMKQLASRVEQGDIVVFHYSGHGSQMTDREGDEADGLDETIVPFDSGRCSDPSCNRDITDDEIYLWLRGLTAKTTAVTLIFDCCHSGTIVRDSFGGEMRWVEPDLRPLSDLPPSPIPLEARSLLDGSRDLGPSGWLPLGERYALIAGCSSEERSYELAEGGVRHGALTYFLAQELLKAEAGTTYRDVFEAVAPQVSARFPNQHPQLEGARDLEIFGVRRIEPMAFVPVRERVGDRVILGAGGACGLSEGSQWAVYKAGTKALNPGEEPLGRVSITAVRAVTSEARILEEATPGAVERGMRALEEIHAVETRMPVQVDPAPDHGRDVQALLDGLGQSKLVRPAAAGEPAQARVYLLAPRPKACTDTPVPTLGPLTEETWAVVGEDGDLLTPPHRRSEPGVTGLLVDNLEKVARHRLVLGLKNERSALAGKVDAELFRWVGGDLVKPEAGKGGDAVFYEGDRLVLRITHRHDKPLFVYILDLGLTGRIQLVYPVSGVEDALLPQRPLDVGAREGEELVLYMPEEFPFFGEIAGDEGSEGVETLKIFATTHPTDFYPLFQGGVRGGKGGPVSSLGDLLTVTFGGGGYRDFRVRAQADGPEDWTTLERSFRLRRPASSWLAAGGRSL